MAGLSLTMMPTFMPGKRMFHLLFCNFAILNPDPQRGTKAHGHGHGHGHGRICTCSVPARGRRCWSPFIPPVHEPHHSSLSHPSQPKAGTPAPSWCATSAKARPRLWYEGSTRDRLAPHVHVEAREGMSHQHDVYYCRPCCRSSCSLQFHFISIYCCVFRLRNKREK